MLVKPERHQDPPMLVGLELEAVSVLWAAVAAVQGAPVEPLVLLGTVVLVALVGAVLASRLPARQPSTVLAEGVG